MDTQNKSCTIGDRYVEFVQTVDDRWMILVNGFQWGAGEPDASGAYSTTWETIEEAIGAWNANRR